MAFWFICQRMNSSIHLFATWSLVSLSFAKGQSRSGGRCSAFSVHREDKVLCFWTKWTSRSKCSGRKILWTKVCRYLPHIWLLLLQNWYRRLLKALQILFFFNWHLLSFIDGIPCLISIKNNGLMLCSPKLKVSLASLYREFSVLSLLNLDLILGCHSWKRI